MLKGSALLVLYAAAPSCSSMTDPGSAGPTSGRVPHPEGFLVTRWRADPFARGSYSYLAVGSSPADRRALAEPVGDRLFFAGEATSVEHPATVHGALESGRAAAAAVDEVAVPGAGVLVIGAGMAGLGAARALSDQGFTVTVIEGRDRIGGRTFTSDELGVPLDLGASWIHGTEGNPVSAIVEDAEIETSATTDYDNAREHSPDGTELTDPQYARAETAFEALMAAADDAAENQAQDGPLGDVLEAAGAGLGLSPADELVVRHYVNTSIEHEYAGSIDDLSTWWWYEGASYGGGDVVLPGGYVQVVDALADGLEVVTGQVVERVEIGSGGVDVVTPTDSFPGDHVVVTLPLGVLQAGAVAFDPPLPADKVTAIGRLGMGLLDKAYLRFPEVFWDADADLIGWVSPDGDGRWGEWVNLAKVTGEPILLGFNAAHYAERVEAMTDEQVVADAMAVLRTIYDR